MTKWKHITMFDRPYPAEKQAEGIAISQAIVGGHCIECGFYKKCTTDNRFKFPVFAWCMRKKAEILADWKKGGEDQCQNTRKSG